MTPSLTLTLRLACPLLLTIGCGESAGPDADGDGFSASIDCNDEHDGIYPGANERCDGLDNDCDGLVDEEGDLIGFIDGDGDGFGSSSQFLVSCDLADGYANNADDCDDSSADISPAQVERCDGIDNNCDGAVDELGAEGELISWLDYDGDGFGDPFFERNGCGLTENFVSNADDCDDRDPFINPNGAEICDGADDDCDGLFDDDDPSVDPSSYFTYWLDDDADTFGDGSQPVLACDAPLDYADNPDDCDDSNPRTWRCTGQTQESAVGSCLENVDIGLNDGLYWLDPDQDGDPSNAWQTWCDLSTDGGGWSLISWSGDISASPKGLPYPGLALCAGLDCDRGSAASKDQLELLLSLSASFAKAQINTPLSSPAYASLTDYDAAGAYHYPSLFGLTLAQDALTTCDDTLIFQTGYYTTLVGAPLNDGTRVFLSPELRYSASASQNDFSMDNTGYLFHVGLPSGVCNTSGAHPGSWSGNADSSEYGPAGKTSLGAVSLWVR